MVKKMDLNDWPQKVLVEQLRLCWEHFRRCLKALNGENVGPVDLIGNDALGDCDDLELFYACKKKGGLSDEGE